jgi:hypothetical protein
MNATSRPSTNESAVASSQYAVGAPTGKRRRAKSGSTMIAIAGTSNHSGVPGASGESRLSTSSSMPVIARNAISTSNPYLRATYPIRLTR